MKWIEFYEARPLIIMKALKKANPNNEWLYAIDILLRETDEFYIDDMQYALSDGDSSDEFGNVINALLIQIEAIKEYCSNSLNFPPYYQPKGINWNVEFDEKLVRVLTNRIYQ